MENGVSFLRNVSQQYTQFDVEWPISVGMGVFRTQDELLIHKGWGPTIDVSSREDFERFLAANSDHDYRASEENIIAILNDPDSIARLKDTLLDYFAANNYKKLIDDMTSIVESKRSLGPKQMLIMTQQIDK